MLRSFSVSLLVLACCLPTFVSADRVQYEFTFDATWSPETHAEFPPNGHFSGVFGAVHNSDFTYWKGGEFATPGVKQIAETGDAAIAKEEVAAAIANGTAYGEVGASGGATSPNVVSSRFQTFTSHSLVSVATMFAPSPDWFTGLSNVSLIDERGNWIPEITIEAMPYDSGTDSGEEFRSADLVTDPVEPIFHISTAPFDTNPPIGSFTLRLVSLPGDVNGSGAVDAGDIESMCFRLGQSHPTTDQAGDPDLIGMDDVNALVERVLDTRAGDADLDGDVDFADFLTLSGNFGEGRSWSGGDFDCNRRIEFADFLVLSANFGFERSAGAVSSVPEPTTSYGLLSAVGLVGLFGRRRRNSTL